ncbi:HpcH/HpaI aldolase/citrate lyase family protein [Streptomyces sp. NBC_01429]|uniref:HpcH/HpaI aldolase/citrate lyase family protein n=1 Tax=Streptomyces sp. NBC_01429 TaxID=2903862 RepID=UPI002E2E8172|nr:aldolase/citrate lyase family protein [Streptomyces sp. NBC_01429]
MTAAVPPVLPAPSVPPTPLTWLYVPGDRPGMMAKAVAGGADVVIVDLEDAVAPDRRAYARDATADFLSSPHGKPVHVRIADRADLPYVTGLPGLCALRLPKIGHASAVHAVAERAPGTDLYALLESALAVEHAYAIASAHPSVRGIALGEADLRADLGVREDAGLDWSRGRAVVAARAAGLAPPAQSVFPDVRDLAGLAASCRHGRALGMLGRAAIHPAQLPVIEEAYRPTLQEVASAQEIIEAAARDAGAQALVDGRFVDAAIVAAARRTLTLAHRP